MVKLYKTTDKVPVKVGPITIQISALSFEQKAEIQAELVKADPLSILRAARLAIKYSVKDVKGVEDIDGNEYQVEMENEMLTDSCVDDVLNLDQDDKISLVCTSLLNGIPKEFVDPQSGKKIEGISIQRGPARKKK